MSGNSMGAQEGRNYSDLYLSMSVRICMRYDGPQSIEQLATLIKHESELTEADKDYMDRFLNEGNRYYKDDSGRWHLGVDYDR